MSSSSIKQETLVCRPGFWLWMLAGVGSAIAGGILWFILGFIPTWRHETPRIVAAQPESWFFFAGAAFFSWASWNTVVWRTIFPVQVDGHGLRWRNLTGERLALWGDVEAWRYESRRCGYGIYTSILIIRTTSGTITLWEGTTHFVEVGYLLEEYVPKPNPVTRLAI